MQWLQSSTWANWSQKASVTLPSLQCWEYEWILGFVMMPDAALLHKSRAPFTSPSTCMTPPTAQLEDCVWPSHVYQDIYSIFFANYYFISCEDSPWSMQGWSIQCLQGIYLTCHMDICSRSYVGWSGQALTSQPLQGSPESHTLYRNENLFVCFLKWMKFKSYQSKHATSSGEN